MKQGLVLAIGALVCISCNKDDEAPNCEVSWVSGQIFPAGQTTPVAINREIIVGPNKRILEYRDYSQTGTLLFYHNVTYFEYPSQFEMRIDSYFGSGYPYGYKVAEYHTETRRPMYQMEILTDSTNGTSQFHRQLIFEHDSIGRLVTISTFNSGNTFVNQTYEYNAHGNVSKVRYFTPPGQSGQATLARTVELQYDNKPTPFADIPWRIWFEPEILSVNNVVLRTETDGAGNALPASSLQYAYTYTKYGKPENVTWFSQATPSESRTHKYQYNCR